MTLYEHLKIKHPNDDWWGDSLAIGPDGKIMSQVCQACGEELVKQGESNE